MCPPGGLGGAQGGPHPLAGVAQRMVGMGGSGQTPPPETWQRAGGSPQAGPVPQMGDMRAPQMMNPAVAQPPAPDVVAAERAPIAPNSGGRYINGPR